MDFLFFHLVDIIKNYLSTVVCSLLHVLFLFFFSGSVEYLAAAAVR